MRWSAIVAMVLGAGCDVDDLALDGKRCPCVDGWTCDVARDVCVRHDGDAAVIDADVMVDARDAAATDGGRDAGADAASGASCLGAAGAALVVEDFADLIGWTTVGGAWSAAGGEAVQSSTAGGLVYAYPAGTSAFTDYRVAATARRTGGPAAGTFELALRIAAGSDGQYHCGWAAATGELRLAWTRGNGTEGGVLAQTMVNVAAIPGYDPTAPVIIEAQVVGTALRCCVRAVADANVMATDTRYTAGSPGIRTSAQATAFDDFTVTQP